MKPLIRHYQGLFCFLGFGVFWGRVYTYDYHDFLRKVIANIHIPVAKSYSLFGKVQRWQYNSIIESRFVFYYLGMWLLSHLEYEGLIIPSSTKNL